LGEKEMSDLKKYIAKRKKTDKEFAEGFEEGYEQFKIGVVLRQARESEGKVLIRRKDDRTFALVPEQLRSSPLDIPSVKADISTEEIVSIVRKRRERITGTSKL